MGWGIQAYVVPEGVTVNGVCGDGVKTVMLSAAQYKKYCQPKTPPKFVACEREAANVTVTIESEPTYKETGCQFLSGEYCDGEVFTKCPGGGAYAWDPAILNFVEITDMSNNRIGKNPAAGEMGKPIRPFICEMCAPVGGGDVTIDNAAVMAQLAGATFDENDLPADDPATVYLHEFDATLTPLGDEAVKPDGTTFVTTTCQAVATDVETDKKKDIEPGGNYALAVPRGTDVPAFSILITEGSNLVLCGSVSVCVDKAGNPVPK